VYNGQDSSAEIMFGLEKNQNPQRGY
jgi:hypothetical protein